MANQNILKDVQCPMCSETGRFAVQVTVNVLVRDDGFDFMDHMPPADHFPGRVLDEDEGLQDTDPISCENRNGCGYRGTVGEFRAHAKELTHA